MKGREAFIFQYVATRNQHLDWFQAIPSFSGRLGDLDALADITGVCLTLEMLRPDSICASPDCTGRGETHCVRGVLPVPAPATAVLLQQIPHYAGESREKLCTPLVAALLNHLE